MKILLLPIFFALFLSGCFGDFVKNSKQANASQDSWVGEGFSGFKNYQQVVGKKYMIATSEKLASEAGAKILAKGGNAIDAAIATQMVLNVVEPHSSGIGGGLFLLYFDNKTKKSVFFNGRETAPAKAFGEMFLDQNGKVRKFEDVVGGGLSVGTPGALHALKAAHKKYGKLPWASLFEPAIRIADQGFPISEKMHVVLNQVPYLQKFDGMKIYFDINGKVQPAGTIIKNYQLAKTFKTIAKQGIETFYQGKIAKKIVDAVQNSKINPGFLSLADLKNYRSSVGNLICADYRQKYKICSAPLPSSGGIAMLQILGILENFDLSKFKPNSLETVHLIAESARLAYADRNEYVADFAFVPLKEMLDKKYLASRAKLIDDVRAMKDVRPGDFGKPKIQNGETMEKPSTTHVSIIDKFGNAVSMTSSIEYLFGSSLVVDGFMLNNQLTDFSLSPKIGDKLVANRVEPNKQPKSSMTPTFVFDESGKLLMIIGSPGGPRIIQFVVKTIIGVLDFGLDVQQAISMPNFVALNDIIELEKRTDLEALKTPLQKMGHEVKIVDITSAIQGVVIKNDRIFGGADPRRQGLAIGQ